VGEHIAVVWNRLYAIPSLTIRSIVWVRTSPPNVVGRAGPASSISTIRMFGAFAGSRRGATRCLYTDSCIVRPAMLAEGVGGNGSDSCFGALSLGSDIPSLLGVPRRIRLTEPSWRGGADFLPTHCRLDGIKRLLNERRGRSICATLIAPVSEPGEQRLWVDCGPRGGNGRSVLTGRSTLNNRRWAFCEFRLRHNPEFEQPRHAVLD
jgi:hypothetical protein